MGASTLGETQLRLRKVSEGPWEEEQQLPNEWILGSVPNAKTTKHKNKISGIQQVTEAQRGGLNGRGKKKIRAFS